ncbi:MAG TPA: hypothetical protein VF100_02995 [Thermoanaerobaculia bacterium]
MLTTRPRAAADGEPAAAGARRTAADHWQRAREVLRDEGPRSLFWKLLGETIYRRAWVVERRLDGIAPAPPGPPAPAAPGCEIGELAEADIAAYLDLRPQSDAATLRRRLAAGERCFVARRNGRIEHATWVAVDLARIEYLGRTLPLAPGDAYAGEAFTRPAARGAALSVAVADAMAARLGGEGLRRLLGVVMPENRAGVVSSWRWGYRPIGVMRTLRLGPWRLFLGGFAPSPRQARRLARTVWREPPPPPAPDPGDS